jgi:hypothetical protein
LSHVRTCRSWGQSCRDTNQVETFRSKASQGSFAVSAAALIKGNALRQGRISATIGALREKHLELLPFTSFRTPMECRGDSQHARHR